MINIDPRSTTPMFEQIFEQIRKMMILNIYKVGDQIPTVRQLARTLGVNPNTITKAYALCEQYDLIQSRPGLGYFVQDNDNARKHAMVEFETRFKEMIIQLKDLGFDEDSILEMMKGELHVTSN